MDLENANRERERRARAQTIRMGLMICSALILLDYVNSPRPSQRGPASGPSVDAAVSMPRQPRYLSPNETSLLNDAVISNWAVGNLSTVYRGSWEGITAVHEPKHGSVEANRANGDIVLQLRMLPLAGSPNIVFVYGVFKLTKTDAFLGEGGFLRDSYYPLQGVYLLRENVLTAALTPTRRHRVFLSVPGDSPKAGNKMAANLQIVNRNLQELPDDVVDMHWVTQAFAEVSDFVSPSSWIDRAMESLGYGARLFNYRRHYINEIIKFKVSMLSNLSRSVEPDVGRGPVEEAWTNLGVDKISKNSRSLNSVTMQDNSSSNFLNRLIPQHALTDSIKSNMNILSSVPVGSSGIRLVSVKLGQSVPTGANSGAVGLGDDIIPTSFKSMQLQLGSNLDSLCSSTTTIQVERVGNLVKGASSSNSQLVKKLGGKLVSSGCGKQLNLTLTEYHIDVETLGSKVGTYSNLLMVVCSIQIYLLVLQMKHSEPQGSSSRISMLTVGSQALLDAVLCVGHLLLSVAIPSVFFYYFMWIAIFKLVIYSVLEMRMMIGIYRARNLQNVELNNALALRRYLSVIHTRFFVALFAAMLSVNIFYDRPFFLVFLFYSFWVPQIVYNAFEGTKQPYLPHFAVGISITRLFIPLYIFGCPENFLAEILGSDIVSFSTCMLLIVWLSCQLVVLELQAKFGPRFFIPKRFLPVAYDYHRPLRCRISEMSPLRGGDGESLSTHDDCNRDIESGDLKECVICYNSIQEVDRDYMITPCDHLFHAECLSRWMDVKLECPVCRAPLPPLIID